MRTIVCILSMFLFVMCGNKGKVQTLSEEEEKEEPTNLYLSEVIMDTVPPPPGIRYKEERSVRPSQPVKRIDLTQRHSEKAVDMGDYYSSVRFITLRHPRAEEGIGFLADVSAQITFGQGMGMMMGYSSSVYLTDGKLVAGDRLFGYYSYNHTGEYEGMIAQPESRAIYDVGKNNVTMTINSNEMNIDALSVVGENCLYISSLGDKRYMEIYNLPVQRVYFKRPLQSRFVTLLNPETIVSYNYNVLAMEREPFMYSFDIKGDTLCRFMNYNPLPVSKPKTYTNPQNPQIYHYDDVLTIWQPYNDTIFRMISAKDIVPAYTVNLGDRKLDLETALYGKKEDKLIPGVWMEAHDFIYISCTEGHDTPNSRRAGTVKFRYMVYDKKNSQICSLPDVCVPEELLFTNSLPEGLPLFAAKTKSYRDKLYTSYSKRLLNQLIKSSSFTSFPPTQQEKIKQLHNDLSETDLLIMIME